MLAYWSVSMFKKLAYQIYREATRKVGLISDQNFNQLIKITTDRNQTSHSYDEVIAEKIAQRLQGHYKILRSIINSINL